MSDAAADPRPEGTTSDDVNDTEDTKTDAERAAEKDAELRDKVEDALAEQDGASNVEGEALESD